MSADFVSKTHIDALVSAALLAGLPGMAFQYYWHNAESDSDGWTRPSRGVTLETAGRTGEMLWRANWETTMGVWADDPECPYPTLPEYRFERLQGRPSALIVLRLLMDYKYQTAGDSGEFESTEAWAFCQSLESDAVGRLPGFHDLPWALQDSDRDVFERYPERTP